MTCIAGSPDCIGNAAMTDREVAFNQQINALVPHNGDSHFLYNQFLVGKRLVQQASTAGMKGIVSKGRFERIKLVIPPIKLQCDFTQRVLTVERLAAMHRASLAQLDALFASLQHRAFRGAVSYTHLDVYKRQELTDEAATRAPHATRTLAMGSSVSRC